MEKTELLRYKDKRVQAKFRDGSLIKTAEGILKEVGDGFAKITGRKGTIILNQGSIIKIKEETDSQYTL
ncbi:MAG TPA: hypothetical protein VFF28_04695 [Candidatus Nanoarchaeia archaeon]|nr:hypothetical protein [Candidatus Nanoarchaeia archaeon]